MTRLPGADVDREFGVLLRRRFLWLSAGWILFLALGASVFLFRIFSLPEGAPISLGPVILLASHLAAMLLVAFTALGLRRSGNDRILTAAYLDLAGIAILLLAGSIGAWATDDTFVEGALSRSIVILSIIHVMSCAVLPWRTRQAFAPLLIIYPLWFVAVAITYTPGSTTVISSAGSAALLSTAGLLLCAWRFRRLSALLNLVVLRRRVDTARRTLLDARKIHETRFPPPMRLRDLEFVYSYEPMRQIGGDFVHYHRDPEGRHHIALIDVTGHGISAALTVNRIIGELDRLLAENPGRAAVDLICRLNRYLTLTLARHGIFATGFWLTLDREGRLEWCNCGHPPALLRRRDGRVERLNSTTFLLGVCDDGEFEADSQSLTLEAGDTLLLYTDGACEAADARGRQLGIDGLERIVAAWDLQEGGPLVEFVPEAVRRYRNGSSLDDILVVTVQRRETPEKAVMEPERSAAEPAIA